MAAFVASLSPRRPDITFVPFKKSISEAELEEFKAFLRQRTLKGKYTYDVLIDKKSPLLIDKMIFSIRTRNFRDTPAGFYFTDPNTAMVFRLRFG